jgi:hypothetical protein
MHPGYLQVLKHYADDAANCNYQSVHMTSNLSPGISWFQKYVDATRGLHRVSVTASYHKEFAIRDKFVEKLIFLQKNDVQVTINMVMVPERFELLWEDAMFFHQNGVNVTLKPQSNPTATKVVDGYSDDQLKRLRTGMPQRDFTTARVQSEEAPRVVRPKAAWPKPPVRPNGLPEEKVPPIFQVELTGEDGTPWYMDQAERFNAFEFNNFKGWECSAGFRSIIIREPDGFIKRSYSCNDKPLGHIEKGFSLHPRPMECQTGSCVSSADSKIPKRKCGAQLPLWPKDPLHYE